MRTDHRAARALAVTVAAAAALVLTATAVAATTLADEPDGTSVPAATASTGSSSNTASPSSSSAPAGLVPGPPRADPGLGSGGGAGSGSGSGAVDAARTAAEQSAVLRYWTAGRRLHARKADTATVTAGPSGSPVAPSSSGQPAVPGQPDQVDQPAVTVPPRRTDQADRQDPTDLRDEAVPAGAAPARVPRSFAVPAASAEPGGPGTSPERLAAPAPRRLAAAGAEARGATSASPSTGAPYRGAGEVIKAVGRLYFTLSGVDYVCSATSISSANRDLLVTAGHCIHGGGQGQAFATNVSFAPGYVAGALHYGLWTARRLIAPQSWTASQDFNHDVGFVVLNTRNGQHLADVVGTERIAFDTPRSWPLYVFGYPAQPPYNGGTLVYCSGTPGRDPYGGTQDSMACSMTSGASGGPWLAKFGSTRPGGGYVVSVISYAYEGDPNHLYGPYFDTIIGMVWFKAQAA